MDESRKQDILSMAMEMMTAISLDVKCRIQDEINGEEWHDTVQDIDRNGFESMPRMERDSVEAMTNILIVCSFIGKLLKSHPITTPEGATNLLMTCVRQVNTSNTKEQVDNAKKKGEDDNEK